MYMEGRGVLFWITEPHKARAHLYPQANANKEITERIRAALYQWPQELGKLEVKQIPLVFGYAWAD